MVWVGLIYCRVRKGKNDPEHILTLEITRKTKNFSELLKIADMITKHKPTSLKAMINFLPPSYYALRIKITDKNLADFLNSALHSKDTEVREIAHAIYHELRLSMPQILNQIKTIKINK